MVALDLNEGQLQRSNTVADLMAARPAPLPEEPIPFPAWNRTLPARIVRWVMQAVLTRPLTRLFVWLHVEGRENLKGIQPPVIFAVNHQSHFDVPVVLAALPGRWQRLAAPAMSKEFFEAHFYPERTSRWSWFTNSLNYYLACLVFNAFPLPQREAGAAQALRYAGELASDGWCVLIFPEGVRTDAGEIRRFQPGVAMMASRLRVPVVPVRLVGLEKILHKTWKMAAPGRAAVYIGKPLHLEGDDYAALAKSAEEAVKSLVSRD